jgi:hypothetical protein
VCGNTYGKKLINNHLFVIWIIFLMGNKSTTSAKSSTKSTREIVQNQSAEIDNVEIDNVEIDNVEICENPIAIINDTQRLETLLCRNRNEYLNELKNRYPDIDMIGIFSSDIPEYASIDLLRINNLDEIINKTYTVDPDLPQKMKDVHEMLRDKKLYKITNIHESHGHYYYKTGVNNYQDKFDAIKECSYGGLHFASEEHIEHWTEWGVYIREIYLLPNSEVTYGSKKGKTSRFIMGKRQPLTALTGEKLNLMNCVSNEMVTIAKILNNDLLSEEETISSIKNTFRPKHIVLSVDKNHKYKNAIYKTLVETINDGKHMFIICKLMVEPSIDIQLQIVKKYPYCISLFPDYTDEMFIIVLNTKPQYLTKINYNNKQYQVLVDNIDADNKLYNISYLSHITNQDQEMFMRKSKYNVLLFNNPDKTILDICKVDPELRCYYDMYFNNIDYWKILNDCTSHNGAYDNHQIANRLYSMLNVHFGDDDLIFLKNLDFFGGYISGSFAMNAIYDLAYDYSDIDIYFNDYQSALEFGNTLMQFKYLRATIVTYNAYSILGSQIDKIITHKVMNPSLKMPKIQLIIIKNKLSVVNYIMTYYDIDHCKVAISGLCQCYKYHERKTISDHIFNVFKLFNSNLALYDETTETESKKYYSGLLNSMQYYIIKIRDRHIKYVNRGVVFDEDNIAKFNECIGATEKIMFSFSNSNTLCIDDIDAKIDNILLMHNVETQDEIIGDTKVETQDEIIGDTKVETQDEIIGDTKVETQDEIIGDTKVEHTTWDSDDNLLTELLDETKTNDDI